MVRLRGSSLTKSYDVTRIILICSLRPPDHCIESLRQSLTCNSDVTANGFDWRDDIKYMMPRINTVHKCRNFDKIKEWAFERFVPLNNLQSNVEPTGLVDWSKTYPNPEDPENLEQHPEFRYTVDDM
jgi:hypothetical protein